MTQPHKNPYHAHQDIALLLPWHINQSLRGAELDRVEKHLKVCLTCRRELANLQKLAAAVQQEGSLDTAAQASFSLLKKRLNGTTDRQPQATPIRLAKRQRFGQLPKPALALAAVILLSLLMPRVMDTAQYSVNDFRTLSSAETTLSKPSTIKVIFSSDSDMAKITALITAIHGQITDGPTEQGLYTLSIDNEQSAQHILKLVASLRKNSAVIFAEPAYALLSTAQPEPTPTP